MLAACDMNCLAAEGVGILRNVFRTILEGVDHRRVHVVPLSGGLDSRGILAGLLEHLDTRQIQAVTFGTPGTRDFDIGQQVARAAGVNWTAIDLTSGKWTWDTGDLMNTLRGAPSPLWAFDVHVNNAIPSMFGADCEYWIGFVVDPIYGSHKLQNRSRSWEEARLRFSVMSRFCRSVDLKVSPELYMGMIPGKPILPDRVMCYDEQLNIAVRQEYWMKRILFRKGYSYQTPLLHPHWVEFILAVPHHYRERHRVYRQVLRSAYPVLFALPTKNTHGLSLTASQWRIGLRRHALRGWTAAKRVFPWIDWAVSPDTNYIDFDRGLRERADLKEGVYECIQKLKRRGLVDWIDVDAIWKCHQRRQGNHADALTLLASLELYLSTLDVDGA